MSAGWAGEALTVLEERSVTWAVLADSSVVVPDLIVSTRNTRGTVVMGKIGWAVALLGVVAVD